MTIELSEEDRTFVNQLVEQGRYASPETAVREGIDQLRAIEADNLRIRRLVEEGLKSAREGRIVTEEQLLHRLAERRRKRA